MCAKTVISLLLMEIAISMSSSYDVHYNTTLTISPDCPTDFSFKNSTKIVIKGNISLDEGKKVSNLDSIAFFGEKGSRIQCNGTNSGLIFDSVSNLVLHGLKVFNCSMTIETADGIDFRSGVYIVNSENVVINESLFTNSTGIGVTLTNLTGNITISSTNFTFNRYSNSDKLEGGGLHIELNGVPANYSIKNCTFEGNNATRHGFSYGTSGKIDDRLTFGRGGGMFVYLRQVSESKIAVTDCSFGNNVAQWGGGCFLKIVNHTENNSVYFENCTFFNNSVKVNGGGGVSISEYCKEASVFENNITFVNCSFINNTAAVGGGVNVVSKTCGTLRNKLEFENCTWYQNSARTSAAIDLTNRNTERSLQPIFRCCKFINNTVINKEMPIQDHLATQINPGLATFMILYLTVEFQEYVLFENNTGTSLYVMSGVVSFSNIKAIFKNNWGSKGGAIFLSYSTIDAFSHSHFEFNGNRASSKGGAIFSYNAGEHTVHKHLLDTCFVHIRDSDRENVTFIFTDNMVGNSHHSSSREAIFAYPLLACCHDGNITENKTITSDEQEITPDELVDCIGQIQFNVSNENCTGKFITGPVERFELQQQSIVIFPGLEFNLSIVLKDVLSKTIDRSLKVWIKDAPLYSNSFQYTSNRVVILYGRSGMDAVMVVRCSFFHDVDLFLNFTFKHCPPGFAQNSTQDRCSCSCKHSTNAAYYGTTCLDNRSRVQRGIWIGYISSPNQCTPYPEKLYSSFCPLKFCSYNGSMPDSFYELPRTSSCEALDKFVCGKERTGILCGECRENYSVYFHSPYYDCKGDANCKYGWLFYIVSELLPLTVAYVIIIVFNVKLTSGSLNGFIFFAQIIDTFGTSFVGTVSINRSNVLDLLTRGYELVYRLFNLDFFGVSSLSFCLWRGATTLDIIAIKYLTVAYAFFLVVITVLVIRYCTRCCRFIHKSYVVHGLSAFLIICYVQCVYTSFKLLIPTNMYGLCSKSCEYRGVFYSGGVGYFSKDHAVYAFLALACIVTIVIIPPIVLLWYPTGRMLLGKCGLSEYNLFSRISCINRMKPLLDSFQSCYKDKCRFFSGLNFLYRLLMLIAFASTRGLDQYHHIVEMLLLLMLVLHSIAQPYRKKWHNVLDTLLLADLATINIIVMFLRSQQHYLHVGVQKYLVSAQALQVFLAYLPLMYLVVYIIARGFKKLKRRIKGKRNTGVEDTDYGFPARLLYGSDGSSSDSDSDNHGGSYSAFDDNGVKLKRI